jgi:hypothetical protein
MRRLCLNTLGLGPPRANFIWQLSLPVASTVAMRNVCLTSIHAFDRSRPTSERGISVGRDSSQRCLFGSHLRAGRDSRQERLRLRDLREFRRRRKAFERGREDRVRLRVAAGRLIKLR